MKELVFLGTSATAPTKDRNVPALLFKYNDKRLLFECGEGTQRQFLFAKESILRLNYVFISHAHLDHWLGLPGMLSTMALHKKPGKIVVFLTSELHDFAKRFLYEFENERLDIKLEFRKIKEGVLVSEKDFKITAVKLNHDVECYGFLFEEKDSWKFSKEKLSKFGVKNIAVRELLEKGSISVLGKRVSLEDVAKQKKGLKLFIAYDTLGEGEYINEIPYDAVLVHEATFLEKDKQRARDTWHTTAREAGRIAELRNARLLILTHLSARVKDNEKFEIEARREFPNVLVPKDFDRINLLKHK